ncbi:MAG: hypothetical protein AAFW47_03075 [Pseudomonadota bacterium]
MAKIALVTVHGMGETETGYASRFFDEIDDRLSSAERAELHTNEVYYQDILQANQVDYFDRVKRRLEWDKMRKFVLFGIGDAASLESQKSGTNSPYFKAQKAICDTLKASFQMLDPGGKLVMVAQSLGGQVLSNYLWDAKPGRSPQNGLWSSPPSFASAEEEAFCRGGSLVRLYTTGCNIPIFVAGFGRAKITAIDKPNADFKWVNFFDDDDVLGWPLQPLSDSYNALVKDKKVSAGLLSSFTPLSHVNYWKDREVVKPIAQEIKRLM